MNDAVSRIGQGGFMTFDIVCADYPALNIMGDLRFTLSITPVID
jgi:hypothetical protein